MLQKISFRSCLCLSLLFVIAIGGCEGEKTRVVGGTDEQIKAYEDEMARVEAEKLKNPDIIPQ